VRVRAVAKKIVRESVQPRPRWTLTLSVQSSRPIPLTARAREPDRSVAPLAGYLEAPDSAAAQTVGLVAFERLYREQFAFVWRALRALGVSATLIDDASQEVWLTVHRRLPEFEARSSMKTWLFGIALNVSRNLKRRARRAPAFEELPLALSSPLPDPAAHREGQEAWALVSSFVATLEQPKREIFVSSLLEGLSPAETAQATGFDILTVYHRVRALRRSFKIWIEKKRGVP
jgi:RNA polymerase sigma-70 factor, ECF subfamily